jgi:hypothetical protein
MRPSRKRCRPKPLEPSGLYKNYRPKSVCTLIRA